MDRWARIDLFRMGLAKLMLATSRLRLAHLPVLHAIPSGRQKSSGITSEAEMTRALELPPTTTQGLTGAAERIGAIASTVAAEQTLALHAAEKAALPRRKLAELRAMYVKSPDR